MLLTFSRGLKGLKGEKMKVTGSSLGSNEYSLVELKECTVFLVGQISALHIRNLEDCVIVAGPVAGSILIEGECAKCNTANELLGSLGLNVCCFPCMTQLPHNLLLLRIPKFQ